MTPAERDARLAALGGMGRVWGGLSHGQGDTVPWLIQLCREWVRPDFVMAEVGVFRGVSTRVFACFARTVYAVDAWADVPDYPDLSRGRLEEAEAEFLRAAADYPNIRLVRELSWYAATLFGPGVLNAVYLDGDHREGAFRADVAAWLPKLKDAGLLMGHDYSQVGNYFAGLGLPKPAAVYPDDSWVVRRADIGR